jgi:hypothetical protein
MAAASKRGTPKPVGGEHLFPDFRRVGSSSAREQILGNPLSCSKAVESSAGCVSESGAMRVDGAAAGAGQMYARGVGGFVRSETLNGEKWGRDTTKTAAETAVGAKAAHGRILVIAEGQNDEAPRECGATNYEIILGRRFGRSQGCGGADARQRQFGQTVVA